MSARTAGYWGATALVAFALTAGGFADLTHHPAVAGGMDLLGYPRYFMTILGIWKLLGAVVLLAPGLPLVKEWAYAGTVLDLTGACFSHLAVGEPATKLIAPATLTLLAGLSWAWRPASRRLPLSPARKDAEDRA